MKFNLQPFKQKPTLEELQAQDEYTEIEYSIAKKKALMKELEQRNKRWQDFSNNGKKSGISFQKIVAWIKSH